MFTIIGAMAELERNVICERVIAGLEYARQNGTKSGKAVGRPRWIFDRSEVTRLREGGLSIREDRPADGNRRWNCRSGGPGARRPRAGRPKPFVIDLPANLRNSKHFGCSRSCFQNLVVLEGLYTASEVP